MTFILVSLAKFRCKAKHSAILLRKEKKPLIKIRGFLVIALLSFLFYLICIIICNDFM